MHEIILNKNHSFAIECGQTILEAARNANISWPYSCKNGRCNMCKCQVINGTTMVNYPEVGLTADEKNKGWILGCARTASTNLILKINGFQNKQFPSIKQLPCKINSIEKVSPDIIKATLRFPKSTSFDFFPGQYVEVIGNSGIRRSYSIANSNFSTNILELHIKYIKGGAMSEYWFKTAMINDLLRIEGPMGTFSFNNNNPAQNLIFLATGTGIAPVKSILESIPNLNKQNRPENITLLWGNRLISDIYLNIDSLPNLNDFNLVLSQPDYNWTGAVGYIQDILMQMNISFENTEIYACGSPLMINDTKNKLINLGYSINRFYSDAFVSSI